MSQSVRVNAFSETSQVHYLSERPLTELQAARFRLFLARRLRRLVVSKSAPVSVQKAKQEVYPFRLEHRLPPELVFLSLVDLLLPRVLPVVSLWAAALLRQAQVDGYPYPPEVRPMRPQGRLLCAPVMLKNHLEM